MLKSGPITAAPVGGGSRISHKPRIAGPARVHRAGVEFDVRVKLRASSALSIFTIKDLSQPWLERREGKVVS